MFPYMSNKSRYQAVKAPIVFAPNYFFAPLCSLELISKFKRIYPQKIEYKMNVLVEHWAWIGRHGRLGAAWYGTNGHYSS